MTEEKKTLSFVCKRYPYKLIKHLQEVRHLSIEEHEKGIYYILGGYISNAVTGYSGAF